MAPRFSYSSETLHNAQAVKAFAYLALTSQKSSTFTIFSVILSPLSLDSVSLPSHFCSCLRVRLDRSSSEVSSPISSSVSRATALKNIASSSIIPERQLNHRQVPGGDSSLKYGKDVLLRSSPLRSIIRLENNLLRASSNSAVKPGLEPVHYHADASAS